MKCNPKYLILMLAAIVACSAASSCSDTEQTQTDESTSTTDTTAQTTEETGIPDGLPEIDYNGEVFTIATTASSYYQVDDASGDILNDAFYTRQRKVEERFNIDLKAYNAGGINENIDAVKTAVRAGDDEYQLAVVHSNTGGAVLVTENMLLPWDEIQYIDTTKPWWNPSILETNNILGKHFYLSGSMCYESPACFFYNPALGAKYELEDIFTVIEEGRWTIDYMMEITEQISADLNGDGKYEIGVDQFGCAFNDDNRTVSFMYGAGIHSITLDDNLYPVMNVNTEKMQILTEKIYSLAYEDHRNYLTTYATDGEALDAFSAGRVLMFASHLRNASSMRNSEVDFNVIPYPKFDETQENYHSYYTSNGLVCAPITIQDIDRTGIITEAFAAESYREVDPVFYSLVLSEKYLRDEKSVAMIDVLYDGIIYDYGDTFDSYNGVTWTLPTLIKRKSTDVASYWAKMEKKVKKYYEKLYDAVENYET